jgi:hypothetical protein
MNYLRTLGNLETIVGSDNSNSGTDTSSLNSVIEKYRKQQKKLGVIVLAFFVLFVTGAGCIFGLKPHDTVDLCNTEFLSSFPTNTSTANTSYFV